MANVWKTLGMVGIFGGAVAATGQDLAATAPLLTLSSPAIRAAMAGVNLPRALQDKIPDFRLKLDRSGEFLAGLSDWDERLRGFEIRVPTSALWVGYNLPDGGEAPWATLSIRMGF